MWWTWLLLACGPPSVAEVASTCGDCHTVQAEQFAASAHTSATTSPVFQALRADADDVGLGGQCDGCHLPVSANSTGFGCVTCHSAVGHRGVGDGKLVHDPWGGVQASVGAQVNAPHALDVSGFLSQPELCGACHDATGPGVFVERPFEHWQAGGGSETCQDCHMGAGDELSHRSRVWDDPVPWFDAALELEVDDRDVEVRARHVGHAVPDGASFVRSVKVIAWDGDQVVPWANGETWWLSSRAYRNGLPTYDMLGADEVRTNHVLSGQPRRRRLVRRPTRVCVEIQRYDPGLVAALGLERLEAGDPHQVACVPPRDP
jgi:hypothetical protein